MRDVDRITWAAKAFELARKMDPNVGASSDDAIRNAYLDAGVTPPPRLR